MTGRFPLFAFARERFTLRRSENPILSIGERYRIMSLPVEFDATFGGTLEPILSDEDRYVERPVPHDPCCVATGPPANGLETSQ
jgi:hypothetical protein